ncbi:hypothetical protein DU500_08760 [Haloplanus rubicundus]|uniref:Uncharacterized protein n=1 Tax=Haloplanus rubicundus TaxID=1547898 RepID=A0A345ECK0_9EURY|nr:hypothetical protein [Haloplanus rubicundus]AXG06504.1 hypothetical protein DU500_08760 [Haloplanus rubicundus]AXG09922.1 hypothetical protein DU484_08720 [Haloplanus rubicundus]
MSRSSARGQVEPIAALVCLLAVCAAVSTYATALAGAGYETERDVATPTLDRVVDRLAAGGVAVPDRTERARRAGPAGYRLNVTVAAAGERWHAGPRPPGRRADTDTAGRTISVRLAPGRIRPGRVRVEVWA